MTSHRPTLLLVLLLAVLGAVAQAAEPSVRAVWTAPGVAELHWTQPAGAAEACITRERGGAQAIWCVAVPTGPQWFPLAPADSRGGPQVGDRYTVRTGPPAYALIGTATLEAAPIVSSAWSDARHARLTWMQQSDVAEAQVWIDRGDEGIYIGTVATGAPGRYELVIPSWGSVDAAYWPRQGDVAVIVEHDAAGRRIGAAAPLPWPPGEEPRRLHWLPSVRRDG